MYEIKNKTYFITEKFLSWWHIKIEFYEVYPYHFRSNENYILSSVYFLDFLIIITETGNSWNLKLYFLNNKFIHFLNYSEKCGLLATWMVCSHPQKVINNSWNIIQTNIGYKRWKLSFFYESLSHGQKNHLAWIILNTFTI